MFFLILFIFKCYLECEFLKTVPATLESITAILLYEICHLLWFGIWRSHVSWHALDWDSGEHENSSVLPKDRQLSQLRDWEARRNGEPWIFKLGSQQHTWVRKQQLSTQPLPGHHWERALSTMTHSDKNNSSHIGDRRRVWGLSSLGYFSYGHSVYQNNSACKKQSGTEAQRVGCGAYRLSHKVGCPCCLHKASKNWQDPDIYQHWNRRLQSCSAVKAALPEDTGSVPSIHMTVQSQGIWFPLLN